MVTGYPKPLASARKLANYKRKEHLAHWRMMQYSKVYKRAKGLCEIRVTCEGRVMNDCHHVYGRGKDMYDWREQAEVMLATCRKCHTQPIKHRPAGPKLAWVEDILEKVNG